MNDKIFYSGDPKNYAFQFIQRSILDISRRHLEFIFQNNVFSYFYLIQSALPHMKKGSSIVNTASVTAFRGNKDLIDYSAAKGAVVALTRSLALSLADKGIRVNSVAPGPIRMPLIPASYSTEEVTEFGTTKAAKMYFSMSSPSPADGPFPNVNVAPPSFNNDRPTIQ